MEKPVMARLPVYTSNGAEYHLFNVNKICKVAPDRNYSRLYLDDGTDVLLAEDIREISNLINGRSMVAQ